MDNPTYWPVIRDVLNCWGGIIIPKTKDGGDDEGGTERTFFKAKATEDATRINPPIIGFVGAMDTTIYYTDDDSQDFLFSVNSPWKQSNNCVTGTYKLKNPGMMNNIFSKQCSALNMYNILRKMNVSKRFTELYIDCDMAHGINNISTDNFSISPAPTSKDDVYTYIVIRAAIFFQTIMNVLPTDPFPTFGYRKKSLFIDLMNNRICTGCNGDTDDAPGCTIEDVPCPE